MVPQSFLLEASPVLVADASTVININATGNARRVLRAVSPPVKVLDVVLSELEDGRIKGRTDADHLKALITDGLVDIVTLGSIGYSLFETLVVGPASETLDDGEAATIAYAVESGALPVIDENKANRICSRRFPELNIACTIDLLAHPNMHRALGKNGLEESVLRALQVARMQVPPRYLDWVIGIIGSTQASLCPSLPSIARKPAVKRTSAR